ncbi:MAG: patatin-like phospholipase family protein [Candidatus Bipolaricaulia bacterium]
MDQRLGLALGGGGARGLAHLGVLIALQEAGVPIEAIAGTSMGAVMGATRAIGADLKKIRTVLGCLNLNEILQVTDSTLRELQKIIGRSVVEYVRGSAWRQEEARPHDLARLRELFSLLTARKSFADAQIPFAVVATDLETGERVVLREGRLAEAVTASTAVPGVFSPVARDGRFLIDGGVVDKLPIDVVVEMGANVVLAVDTGAPLSREIATCLDALLQSQRATSHHLTRVQLERSSERLDGRLLVLRPDVGWIKMFGFEHSEEAIEVGANEVRAHLDQIRALLETTPPGD